jgi:hypothetical protein
MSLRLLLVVGCTHPAKNESEDMTMMWGYGYDPGWGGWLMMGVGNILWIALLGLLVWAVIRLLWRS